ncbi:MAG: hypothetical protein K2H98_04700, partial [Duncaniella sp.]|nr:hypothetical protein [Duncaniella sp.]
MTASAPDGSPAGSSESGPLESLIDKAELKSRVEDIVAKARSKADFCRKNGIKARMQLSFVITGDAGTGKTTVAHVIAKLLANAGVARTPVPETVNPVDYD